MPSLPDTMEHFRPSFSVYGNRGKATNCEQTIMHVGAGTAKGIGAHVTQSGIRG
jgi:hypothetical protein